MLSRPRLPLVLLQGIAVGAAFGLGATAPAYGQWPEESRLIPAEGAFANQAYGHSVAVTGDVAVVGAFRNGLLGSTAGNASIYRYDGNTWGLEQQVLPTAINPVGDQFGYAVAVDGDVLVVGAPYTEFNGTLIGAAYVYRYTGAIWHEEQKLFAPDGMASDLFGSAVAISGDVVVVGASDDDDSGFNSGSAYLFRYDGAAWGLEQKLHASDGAVADAYGYAVSISRETILIGAPGDDDSANASGSAYIYRFDGTGWVEEDKLVPSDGTDGAAAGIAVSLSGETALIGARTGRVGSQFCGVAYIFRFNGADWSMEQKLFASDHASTDYYGGAVTISGNVAVVGATGDDDLGSFTGSAYVYRYNGATWLFEQKVLPTDGILPSFFGAAVSVWGDTVLIGGYYDGTLYGSAYIRRFTGPVEHAEEQKITPADAADDDQFGNAVAVHGDVAIVGAFRDDDSGMNAGSAYVYRYDGADWLFEKLLLASDGAGDDRFGCAVATSGSVAFVGANEDDDLGAKSGAAYVFRYDGTDWTQEQKLLPADGDAGDEFGHAIALYGDVAIIGAHFDEDTASNAGSAYVFRYDGAVWNEEQKLLAPDGAASDHFGDSVSISGDVIVVGAPGDDDFGSSSGSIYVYRYDGLVWNLEQKIVPTDGATSDDFGDSVSVSGDALLVAASGFDELFSGGGAAYIFRYNGTTWVQEQPKLLPSDGANGQQFGSAVSLWGDMAVIGADRDPRIANDAGAAYVFRYDGSEWRQEQKLLATEGAMGDFFGHAVATWGGTTVVGAYWDDEIALRSGSMYVFRGGEYVNTAPVAVGGGPYIAECRDHADGFTTIDLDGSASFDPNKDTLQFQWSTDGGTFDDDTLAQPNLDVTGIAPGTVINITLDVSDGALTDQASTTVTVQDTFPPLIALDGEAHVTLECSIETYTEPGATATDACDPAVAVIVGGDTVNPAVIGLYTITYNATDASGNMATEVIRTVTVQDTTPPVITRTGPGVVNLECAVDVYTEYGATATDAADPTATVIIGGDSVNPASPGVYTVTYNATDASGNMATEVSRTVTVQDTIPPVITLDGAPELILECGADIYDEPGATVTDAYDSAVAVTVGGDTVDPSAPGVYTVTYDATDSSGNHATQVTRIVTVQDTTPPEMSLIGENPINVYRNGSFTDPGAIALDLCDGDLTGQVTTESTVNLAEWGAYTITYSVQDANGQMASIQRIVNVTKLQGDVDFDAVLNATDIQLLINIVLGLAPPTAGSSDINGDGATNAVDIQLVINAVLGIG